MSTILDPTKKGTSTSGLFDPGGVIVKKLTGSDFALKAARKLDPLNLAPDESITSSEKKRLASIRTSGQTEAARIFGASPSRKRVAPSLIPDNKFL